MDTYQEIATLEARALQAHFANDYQAAIEVHGQALRLARDLDRPRLTAVLFSRLGHAFETIGEVQDAVVAYEAGLRALAEVEPLNLDEVLQSLRSVGKTFGSAPPEPLPDLYTPRTERDLRAAETDPALAVQLLIDIGNAYLRQPQETPALNAYQQALARPESDRVPELRAQALTHIGVIQQRRGDVEEAETALREALDLFEAHGAPADKRRALAVLAGIYREREEYARARDAYNEALRLHTQVADERGEARTRAALGHLYLELGDLERAREAFSGAIAHAAHIRDTETLWHAYWGMGYCQQAAGDLDAAATSLQRSLDLIEGRRRTLRTDEGKVTFLESVSDVFDLLLDVHLRREAFGAALHVVETLHGRALRDLMGGRRRRRPSAAHEVRPSRRRPFDVRRELAVGMDSSDSPAQMAPGVPSTAFDAGMAAQMAPGVPSGSDADDENTVEEPESTTSADMPPLAHLVFHTLSDRTAVFAITPDGTLHAHVAPIGKVALEERVVQLRRVLGITERLRGVRVVRGLAWDHDGAANDAPQSEEPLLRDLYDTLIAPVAAHLPTDGTPVVIEPHGPLWLLPFAALRTSDDTWLIDEWPLLVTPSKDALEEIRTEPDYGTPAELDGLLVGNPEMPTISLGDDVELELSPLPGTEAEVTQIAALLPAERRRVLLGAEAGRAQVQRLAVDYGVLHLATHGIASEGDPLASFVVLAADDGDDGRLTARQVVDLALPADLVVLSACQTGLGRVSGDGMLGLSRSFLVAGARAVLVSLWSVSDEATADLMTAFYQGYLSYDDKALALQQAMQKVRQTYPHPRDWAAFAVVGAEA